MLDTITYKLKEVLGCTSTASLLHYLPSEEKNDYQACTFSLSTTKIIYREAKVTPKKIGLFVAIWKRTPVGITAPYEEVDEFDCMVIAVDTVEIKGFFLFPNTALAEFGIISTAHKAGKRGVRIYPTLEEGMNKQALTTYNKQKAYFHQL